MGYPCYAPDVEEEYDDDDLAEVEKDKAATAGHGDAVDRAFRKVMNLIRQAPNERALYAFRSLRPEKLKGKRKHQHSLRLNDQWRLVVEVRGEGTQKVMGVIGIEDYH